MIEQKKIRVKKFTWFIGIDVSRNKLDYAVLQGKNFLFHREAKNDPAAILDFVMELKSLPSFTLGKAVFCMEQTGIYCNHLINALSKIKANLSIESPLQIRNSLGVIRGKYDKIDSVRIAHYAQKNKEELKLWNPRRPVILGLMRLVAIRNRLSAIGHVLKTPLKEEKTFVDAAVQDQDVQSCKRSTDAVKADLKNINSCLEKLISSDERLKRLKDLITSVPSVGPVTAIQIIITTNEFKQIRDPKKFACYAGIAPFKKDSGTIIKRARVSNIANKKMKSLLHICAIAAIRSDKELKAYYIRKTEAGGKPKMAVINAVRNKLVLRIFACVNQNRLYSAGYIRENKSVAGPPVNVEAFELQKND